jgi:TRAP-type C4-dicarboxylate transport system permease small subunit
MGGFLRAVLRTDEAMQVLSSIALTFIVLLTTADVVLRAFGRPIPGVYEIVAMCGGIVVGFGVPLTSWLRGHIQVDFLVLKLSPGKRKVVNIITRCVGIAMFVMIGYNIIKIGSDFRAGGEVSPTLQIPIYPIAYSVGFCFLMVSLVLFCDVLKVLGGQYE